MKYDMNWLLKQYDANTHLQYLFFWGHRSNKNHNITKSCLSQWYHCRFTIDGILYHTAEQYMMAQKALLFEDREIFEKIQQASSPSEYKSLGRKIKNFDALIWDSRKTDIVIQANVAKFSQNKPLGQFLIHTQNQILAEASPMDTIWGIGRAEQAMDIKNPHTWQGENLLGFCLMEVRDRIKNSIGEAL